jgi:septal ring factor EnvC (AmiA/AmiB activator)
LEADTNNQKKNFQAEIKRLSVEIAHKDENNAKSHQAFIAKTEEVNNLSKQLKKEQEQSNKLKVNVQNLTNEKRFLEQQEKTNSELKNRELNQSRVKIGELEEQINNLLEKSNQQEDYIEQTKSEKRQLEKEFENIKRDRETKVEELREAE